MNHILICLLTLLFSLSGSAMGKNIDFRPCAVAAESSLIVVHPFADGATHITTSAWLAAHAESATFGGAGGLFVAPTSQINSLIASGASTGCTATRLLSYL
jgi:hypothetical protein